MTVRLLLLLYLTSCAIDPAIYNGMTPAVARAYGVDVPDDAVITGKIVEAWYVDYNITDKKCNLHHDNSLLYEGCAVPIEGPYIWPSYSHRYRIFMTRKKCIGPHEAAHALSEETNHTMEFTDSSWQKLAACRHG